MTLFDEVKSAWTGLFGGILSVPVDLDGLPTQSQASQVNYIALAAGALAMYHLMKKGA